VRTPPRFSAGPDAQQAPDWSGPFELAGLSIDDFEPVEPEYQRFMQLEQRAAWVGPRSGPAGARIRIEAGASGGRLALWEILTPEELNAHADGPGRPGGLTLSQRAFYWILTVGLIGALLLAKLNLNRGRVDRRGVWRLGAFAMVLNLAVAILRSHAMTTRAALITFYPVAATGLLNAAFVMVLYMAIEPYVRRVWPSVLVSWSRLLGRTARDWRDPLLGRSVLGGLAAGTVLALLFLVDRFILVSVQGGPAKPFIGDWVVLLGQRYAMAEIFRQVSSSIGQAVVLAFFLVVGKLVLRRTSLAVVVAAAMYMMLTPLVSRETMADAIIFGVFCALFAVVHIGVLLRYGLVGLIAAAFLTRMAGLTRTADWTAWDAQPAIMALIAVAALAAYGYWAATAGKRFAGDVVKTELKYG
jgi:hypothetical protein